MEDNNETPGQEDKNIPLGDSSLDADSVEPADGAIVDNTDLLQEAAAIRDSFYGDPLDGDPEFTEPAGTQSSFGAGSPPPPFSPPPGSTSTTAPVYAEDRLTRDPFATFGGVLSGIAHRYGWDVALTRIAFVVILLLSGGTAILAYALSWLIIPRAQFWPPAQHRRSQVSGRDLGLGLLALAGLLILGIGSGQFAGVFVPLALIGGGVWLLSQNPRPEVASSGNIGSMTSGPAPTAGFQDAPLPPYPPASPQQPAPQRSRRGRGVLLFGLMAVLAVLVIAVGGLIAVVSIAGEEGEFDFEGGQDFTYFISSIDEIPTDIEEGSGELMIDLTEVDFSPIGLDDDPVELDVSLDFGELVVLLPEDVRVQIDGEAGFAGEVQLFGNESSGFRPDSEFSDANPQLVLDLEVDAGKIEVTRGN